MVDQLPTVDSDGGPIECLPVVVFDAIGKADSRTLNPLGYAQATLSTTTPYQVVAPSGTLYLLAIVTTQDARWRDDGTDPTATIGMPLNVGATLVHDTDNTALRFTAQTAGSILNLAFYGDADA